MTDREFGALAAQLLRASQIPGEALDQALAFRSIADSLARGEAVIAPAPVDNAPPEPRPA